MKEDKRENLSQEEMIKKGLLNVLALGYKGVELWRQNRKPLVKKEVKDGKKA